MSNSPTLAACPSWCGWTPHDAGDACSTVIATVEDVQHDKVEVAIQAGGADGQPTVWVENTGLTVDQARRLTYALAEALGTLAATEVEQ